MTSHEARAYFNYLLTLSIRKEEAFGPLALSFIREHDLDQLGLLPEEQFNLYMATADAFAPEPKRFSHKLDCLQRAQRVLPQTRFDDPQLAQHLAFEIKKTSAELEIYAEAFPSQRDPSLARQRLIIETEFPDYVLHTAQQRAAAYFQTKYKLPAEAKTAQHFTSASRKFEPDNPHVQKEFAGACAPFVSARTNGFHFMLPFDLKISKHPDDPLEAGVRIYYAKMGYSFPLRYDMGKLCSYYDGEVLDIALDDPHLLFVSFSPLKEPSFGPAPSSDDMPPEIAVPVSFLEQTYSLGPFIQISCKCKVWFDASTVSILIQGAPDLHEYGLQGGAGLMTRTYASEKVGAYVESTSQPWQDGLSFNFVNMHLQLLPGFDAAFIPFNTPIFTVYPVLSRQAHRIEDSRNVAEGVNG